MVTFDLSNLAQPITAAQLHLWSGINGFSDDAKPIVQSAKLLDPAGLPAGDSLTFDNVINAAVLADFETFGSYSLDPVADDAAIQNRYLPSPASAADVAALEAVRVGGNPRLVIAMFTEEDGTDYGKSWGDGEFGGEDAYLTTNGDLLPEPASAVLATLISLLGLMVATRTRGRATAN